LVFVWEKFLKVFGWKSKYSSVTNLLRFLRNKRSGSEGSRESYGHALFSFCQFVKKTPDELVKMEKTSLEKFLEEFGYSKSENGRCAAGVNTVLIYIKTFFRCNGFRGEQELNVELHRRIGRSRTRKEYVPTPEEAWRIAECAGSLRDKAIIQVLMTAGLRNATLRAILYGDVREELECGAETVLIRVYPEMKKLVSSACKNNVEYITFVPKETATVLRLYIAQRVATFGKIDDNAPLFASEYNQISRAIRSNQPLSERQLQRIVKDAACRAGLKDWRIVTPHCFRKTYETLLRSRLKDGSRLGIQTIIFLMGHIQPGGLGPYSDFKVEDLRKEYSKIIFNPYEEKLIMTNEVLKSAAEVLKSWNVHDGSIDMKGQVRLDLVKAIKAILEVADQNEPQDSKIVSIGNASESVDKIKKRVKERNTLCERQMRLDFFSA